jgi:WD40 repeat protein
MGYRKWPSSTYLWAFHRTGKVMITSVAFSPNGKHISAGCTDSKVRVCDATTGEVVMDHLTGHDHFVTAVAYSQDGKRIISGSYDRAIRIWDADLAMRFSGQSVDILIVSLYRILSER